MHSKLTLGTLLTLCTGLGLAACAPVSGQRDQQTREIRELAFLALLDRAPDLGDQSSYCLAIRDGDSYSNPAASLIGSVGRDVWNIVPSSRCVVQPASNVIDTVTGGFAVRLVIDSLNIGENKATAWIRWYENGTRAAGYRCELKSNGTIDGSWELIECVLEMVS